MMENFKSSPHAFFKKNHESGFTLIEIIIAIVLIGIAVPGIMIPFSGLGDTKSPEYTIQGSFLAQKRLEDLADQDRNSILTACPNGSTASVTDGPGSAYSLGCTSITVNATTPDTEDTSGTNSATFAQKITLTVTRVDGAMDALTFSQLFALE